MPGTALCSEEPRPSPGAPWRDQLSERRHRLLARPELQNSRDLRSLVEEIDAALARMDQGDFGACEECHDPIETDRLLADPLTRVCLGCLTEQETTALERDLELASSIQEQLLPPAGLRQHGWEIAHRYRPLGPVSGDYCDVLQPNAPGEPLYFLLGDNSGKGVAASLLMATLHAIFRSLVSLELPLHTLVERANRLFCESTLSNSYATLVAGRLLPSGTLEMVNAGHPAPLLTGAMRSLSIPATGLPLGLFRGATFRSVRLELEPGELLVLYTDGVSEARNGGPDMYGPTRLPALVEAVKALDPEAALDALTADLRAFRGNSPLEDDMALMAVRRTDPVLLAGGSRRAS